MTDFENKIAEIVANKLNMDIAEVKEAHFFGCDTKDDKVAVSASAYIGSYSYTFTEDGIMPYYSIAEDTIVAMTNLLDIAEKFELIKERQDNEEMKQNTNFKKIFDCLVESYRRQLDTIIKELAEDTAADIIEENYLLQTVDYEEITYDPEIDADESTELSETEFEIGGKIDLTALAKKIERAKIKAQIEQLRKECMEEDI